DEAGHAALVRTLGPAVGIGSGEEEHRLAGDERAVFVGERRARQLLGQAVGQAPGVETVLQLARRIVVHARIVPRRDWPARSQPCVFAKRPSAQRCRAVLTPSHHGSGSSGRRSVLLWWDSAFSARGRPPAPARASGRPWPAGSVGTPAACGRRLARRSRTRRSGETAAGSPRSETPRGWHRRRTRRWACRSP